MLVTGLLSFCFISAAAQSLLSWDDWPHQRVAVNQEISIHLRYAGSGPPVLLVHGNPQYSLSWHAIAPVLAQNFTVIVPDNRGAGDSTIPPDGNYTAAAHADDLKAVLDFLGIDAAYVFSHDKGAGFAAALAAKYPSATRRVGFFEYLLPGFGYESFWVPSSGGGLGWDLYKNWQLGFFSVPDAATHFITGREKEMLAWYFFHASYSGNDAVSEAHLNAYARSISKPGFLRSMLNVFSVSTVTQDARFFNETIGQSPLQMPVLALGGEASFANPALGQTWAPVGRDVVAEVVPKAGHWLLDENPQWVASRIVQFIGEDNGSIPTVDLSWLTDRVTLGV
ncbi:putative hydrolase [Macrophomina phaseolina]|uniref:Hydrolase n=1 Tax=Macrophomina phaseolina TaxID=35725 RepID=A0ABQ8FTI4_9PEZI|nr:putative hydrolase [Macrophomina phaseolina]